MHGVCREGSQCLFSHDLANSKPSTICKYYQKGYCAYGARCRQGHHGCVTEEELCLVLLTGFYATQANFKLPT